MGAGWVYADKAAPEARINCPLGELARHLERPPWSDRPRTIVASGNFGPELLYRTRHRVVASVYHRNAEGMLAGLAILAGQDEAEILARVRRRRADLILLCPGSVHDGYFLKTGGDSLYRRLERGDVPGWLGEVDLPAGLKGRFMMFRVLPAG